MGKYFNVIVKPTISVAALNAGNISADEVLFDWHGFDIPKGAARLANCTILYSGKNGVKRTAEDFEVYWAKGNADGTGPASFGDDGAAVDTFGWWNNIQGKMTVDASDGASAADIIIGQVLSTQGPTSESTTLNSGFNSDLILQGEPNSGENVGFDKLYIGAVSVGTHNFGPSTMTVDGTMATTSPTLTVADVDALKAVGPGDILRDEDNNLLGTVKTVDSATQITMQSNLANASADDKLVFNTTPITFILSFEQ